MVDVKIQTMYRETEAQTYPWSPPYVQVSNDLPEVLLLNNLKWGKGLPAGQYEVEEITRSRKKRAWEMYLASVQKTTSINFKKKIISQIESDDWEFIAKDLEKISERRMELANKVLEEHKIEFDSKFSKKVDLLNRKIVDRYEEKMKRIEMERDKEIRRINNITKIKYIDRHEKKTIIDEFSDKLSDMYAFKVRLGYHRKNVSIVLCEDAYNKAKENEVKQRKFSPPNRSGRMKKHNCLREQFVDTEEKEFDEYFKKLNFGFEFDNEHKKSKEVDLIHDDGIITINPDLGERRSYGSEKFDELSESEEDQEDPLEVERKRQAFMQTLKDKCMGRHEREMLNKEMGNLESSLLARLLDLTSKEQQRLEEEKKILAMALIAQADRWKREAREDGIRQKQKMRENIRMQILDQAFERISQDLEDQFQTILRDSIMDTAVIQVEENIRTKMYDIDRADVPKIDEGPEQESMIAKLKDHININTGIEPVEVEKSLSDLGEINEAVQDMYQDILSMALDIDNLVKSLTGTEDKSNEITRVQDKIKILLDEDARQPALEKLKDQVENIHLQYQLHKEINEDIKKMDRLCDTVMEIADDLYQTVIGEEDITNRETEYYDDGVVNDEIINYLNKDTTPYIFKLIKLSHILGTSDNSDNMRLINSSYNIMNKAKRLCKSVTTIAAKIHFFTFQNEYDQISLEEDDLGPETETKSESAVKLERFKATQMERLCEKLMNKLISKEKKTDETVQEKVQDTVSDKIDVCQIKKEAAEIIESIVDIWLQIDALLDQLESPQDIDKDNMMQTLQCILLKLEERFGNLNEFLGMEELHCLIEPEKCDEDTEKLLRKIRYIPENYNELIVDTIADMAIQLHNKHLKEVPDLENMPNIPEPLKSDVISMVQNADEFVAISKLME